MADIKKVIEISIDVIGNIGSKLQDASNSFLSVAQSLDAFSSAATEADLSVNTIVDSINSLGVAFDKIKPPSDSFNKMYTELEKLSKLRVPNLKNIVDAMDQMQGMSIPNLDSMTTELKKLDGIKAPQLDQFAKGLERLEKIKITQLNTKITALSGSLKNLSDIKVPQLDQLAKGLQKLADINISQMNTKITALAGSLNNLSSIKAPQLDQFSKGLQKLGDINISQMNTKITALAGSLNNLSSIKAPQLDQFAKGLQKLADINISQMNTKITALSGSLKNLSDIKAPQLDQFSKGLQKLKDIDISQINIKINSLVTSLKELSDIKAPQLNQFSEGLKKLNEFKLDKDLKQLEPILKNVATALKHLENIKIPNLKGLGTAIKELNELDKLKMNKDLPSILSGIAIALDQFKDTKIPGINNFVNGLKKLIDLDVGKISKKIEELNKAILKLDKSGQLASFNKFATNLGRVDKALKGVNVRVTRSHSSLAKFGYAIGSASSGLSVLASKLYGVSRGLSAINAGLATMTGFTAAFAGLYAIKGATSLLMEFDDSIRAAGATAQASTEELGLFEDAARQMGATTRYTATEAAQALKQLSQAGFTVNESTRALPKVLQLAQAGFLDIGEAADITTNVMKGYGMQVSDLGRVNDVLVAAFTNANTNLSQLGTAFAYVGPLAKSAGIEFEETASLLAALAQSGYKSTKAGMVLRNGLVNLLNPTTKAGEAIKRMGIQVKDSEGNMLSMIDIIDQFRQAGADTSDIIDVFGKRAGPGFASLISQGDASLKEFLKTMRESDGIAKEISEQMESGLGGAIRELKSSWQELALEFGRDIEVKLIEYIQKLTEVLRENKTQIADFASDLSMFVANMIDIGVSFLGFISRFKGLTIAVVSLTAAMIALAGAASLVGKTMMAMKASEVTLTGLAAINFAPTIAGLSAINTGLITIGTTMKALGVAMLTSPLATMSKVILYPIMAGVIALETAFSGLVAGMGLVTSAVKALGAAMVSNPLGAMVGIIATIVAAIAAYTIFKQSISESADEHLRNAESIKAEIDALNSQIDAANKLQEIFATAEEGTSAWLDAEKELAQILPDANTSLTEHGDLIAEVGEGYTENKDKLDAYLESLNVKKKLALTMQIEETASALDESSKGYKKQLTYMKRYYATGESNARVAQKILKWVTDLTGTYDKNRKKLLDLQKTEAKSREALDKLGRAAVLNGTLFDDLSNSLDNMNISAEVKQNVLASWKKWNDYKQRGYDIDKAANSEDMNKQIQEKIAAENIQIAKDSLDQRKADLKQHLYDISVLEATGVITHEDAEAQKLATSLDHYGAIYAEAKAYHEKLVALEGSVSEKEREAANEAELQAKEDYYAAKLKALEKYGKDYEKEKKNLNKKIEKLDNEEIKNTDKVTSIKKKAREKQISADQNYADKKQSIESTLSNKVVSINKNLAKKLKGFIQDRIDAERDAQAEIAGIHDSLEDKLRKINQRSMSAKQKEADNRNTANKKLSDGIKAVAEAQKAGDEAALKRSKKLIEQAGSLYEGLSDSSAAATGVKKVADALEGIVGVQLELDKKVIDEKEKAARKEAADAKIKAQKEHNDKLKKLDIEKEKEDKKIDNNLQTALTAEDKRHTKVMSNITKEIAEFKKQMEQAVSMMNQVQNDVPDEQTNTSNDNDCGGYATQMYQGIQDEAEKAIESNKKLVASMGIVRREGESDIDLQLRISNTKQVTEAIKQFKKQTQEQVASDPIQVKADLDTVEVVNKVKELRKEYWDIWQKDNVGGVNTLTLMAEDAGKAKDKLAEISAQFDILGKSSGDQALQDKINLLNAMEKSGIDTTDAWRNLNTELDSVSTRSVRFDMSEGFTLVDEYGAKIKGLRENIQSNPFVIGAEMGVDGKDTLISLQNIDGLVTSIHKANAKEAKLKMDTSSVDQDIQEIKDKKDSLNEEPVKIEFESDSDSSKEAGKKAKDDIVESATDGEGEVKLPVGVDKETTKEAGKEAGEQIKDGVGDIEIKPEIKPGIVRSPWVPLSKGIATIKSDLEDISNVDIQVSIGVDSEKLDELIDTIQDWDVDVKITVTTIDNKKRLKAVKEIYDELVNKVVVLTANVVGIKKWQAALNIYNLLKNKTVTLTTIHKDVSEKAAGGLVEAFATGGQVFSKLSNRFINTGSGNKDDVPAMLMKGEYVHRQSAVQKYGRRFMELVNTGSFPVGVAKAYQYGGEVGNQIVQGFATGGMVVGNLMSIMRKKLEDIVGSGVSLNVGSMSVNNSIEQKANSITSEMGQSSLASMAGSFRDAISTFAVGGTISNDTVSMAKEKRKIEADYYAAVADAKAEGKYEIADILMQEQKDLLDIATTLSETLSALKTDYDTQVADRAASHSETLAEAKEEYDEAVSDENEDYAASKNDTDLDFARNKRDYDIDSAQALVEYEAEIRATEAEYKSRTAEVQSDMLSLVNTMREAALDLNKLHQTLYNWKQYNSSKKWTGPSTFVFREHNPVLDTSIPSGKVYPDMQAIDQLLDSQVGDDERGSYGKIKASVGAGMLTDATAIYADFVGAEAELNGYGITDTEAILKATTNQISAMAKAITDSEKLLALGDLKLEYENNKASTDLDWSRTKEDYEAESAEAKSEHDISLSDLGIKYNDAVSDENKEYNDDLSNYKSVYVDNVTSAKNNADENITSRKAETVDSIAEVNKTVEANIAALAKETESKLNDVSETIPPPGIPVEKESETTLQSVGKGYKSVEDFLKKLTHGIFGFNTGGNVPATSGSTKGKDSVLAMLTPGEAVIREPVVRMFGKDFFQQLNNFKIPQFNIGGIVGDISTSGGSTVTHALELTLNGRTHESLTGSQAGISDILNDLALAKMRS
jgi:TP901 family phage tail tape measure protein